MDKNLETNLRGLQKKREEHRDISERMRLLESSRDTVSQETYSNLRNDYEGKLSELQTFISQTETQANTRATDIDLQTRSHEEKKNTLEKEISEVTLLLENGALSQADFNAKTGEKKRQLRDVERSIGSLAGEKGQIEAYLSGTAVPKGTGAGISAGWLSSLAEKLHISYIKENLGTVLPIAGGVVGFIVLAIVATTFLGGPSRGGSIERFLADFATAEDFNQVQEYAERHFGEPEKSGSRDLYYFKKGMYIRGYGNGARIIFMGPQVQFDTNYPYEMYRGKILLNLEMTDPIDTIYKKLLQHKSDNIIEDLDVSNRQVFFTYKINESYWRAELRVKDDRIRYAGLIRIIR